MLRFTISMDPNIIEIGPLLLTWHAIFSLVAIVVAVQMVRREFARRGLSFQHWDSMVVWIIAGGVIGARLFYVMDHLGYFLDHPLEVFAFQDGGLAIYGAVTGGFAATWITSRFYGYPFPQVIDAIAPGLLIAQAVGRIGCVINGDAWGEPTDSPFALVYTHPDAILPSSLLGVPTQPYPIYDALMNLAIFALIWPLRRRNLPPGMLFAIFAALYAIGRFFISFMRQERVWFWGLQEAQVVSIVFLAGALIALAWQYRWLQQSRESDSLNA